MSVEPERRARLAVGAGAAAVVAAIVVASVVLRGTGPADPAADVGLQRRSVAAFGELVVAGRWAEIYALTTEPPAPDAGAFAALMRERQAASRRITAVESHAIRLRRSRSVPMLEAEQTVTLEDGSRRHLRSYFVYDDGRWLFAFSADAV